jgi:hypothetical protein
MTESSPGALRRFLLLLRQRLPQLNAIALWIYDPGEAAVILVFSVRIDLDPFFFQHLQESIQILYTIINHERGAARVKVVVPRGKIDHTVMLFFSASWMSRHSKAAAVPPESLWIPR